MIRRQQGEKFLVLIKGMPQAVHIENADAYREEDGGMLRFYALDPERRMVASFRDWAGFIISRGTQ